MKTINGILILSILPLLTGCFTCQTVDAAKEARILPDKVYHVEKCFISKDKQLVILLDACLTNASQRSQFTVSVSLEQISKSGDCNMPNSNKHYGILDVSREAIHEGWTLYESPVHNSETIPLGPPIAMPSEITGQNNYAYAFAKYAQLLPNTTQTLYPVIEHRNVHRNDWPSKLEFIYVDASSKQEYTVIYVREVKGVNNGNNGYYFLLPLTIPLDIATSPFQAIGFGFGYLTLAGGVTK